MIDELFDASALTKSTKTCNGCNVDRPVSDFHKCAAAPDGLAWRCIHCRKDYLVANRDLIYERERRYEAQHSNRTKYLLSPEDYHSMLADQGGGCAICGQQESFVAAKTGKPRRFAIDHDHETGRIRGLLCTRCNLALGSFCDDPARLQNAIDYLAAHSSDGEMTS